MVGDWYETGSWNAVGLPHKKGSTLKRRNPLQYRIILTWEVKRCTENGAVTKRNKLHTFSYLNFFFFLHSWSSDWASLSNLKNICFQRRIIRNYSSLHQRQEHSWVQFGRLKPLKPFLLFPSNPLLSELYRTLTIFASVIKMNVIASMV